MFDGVILSLGITSGLNGYIPHFLNPDLMVGIENARSKGALTTRENSLFDTIKNFFVKETARIAFEYWSFNDLKTETSNSCKAWVVCGGKQNKSHYHSKYQQLQE